MKTLLDKIALTLVSKVAETKLNVNDIEVESLIALFEQYTDLKHYFVNTVWELPVIIDSKEGFLHVPAINILFVASRMTVNSYLQNCIWNTFKDNVEYFKEVYFVNANHEKKLLHGLDIVSFSQKTIDSVGTNNSFNIQNIQQLYIFLRKNKSSFTKYNLQPWHYKRHICFDIEFEHLFLRDYGVSNTETNKITFNLKHLNHNYLNFLSTSVFPLELEDFKDMDTAIKLQLYQVLKYKLSMNEVNFQWEDHSVSILIENNLLIFGKTDIAKTEFFNVLINITNTSGLNSELLVLLMLNNLEVYKKLTDYMKDNNIIIVNQTEVEKRNDMVPDNNRNYIKVVQDKYLSYKNSDPEIITLVEKIVDSTELLESSKGLTYFAENMEEKLNYDKVMQSFLIKILDNYFSLPLANRSNKENNFLIMTMEQLSKIEKEIIHWQKKILEDEEMNMRIFGRFLDDKFPTAHNIINIR